MRHGDSSRGAEKLDVDQGGLMLCDVLVLGVPDAISRSTRGSSTTVTRRTLNANPNLGLCVCRAGSRRGVLRVGSTSLNRNVMQAPMY